MFYIPFLGNMTKPGGIFDKKTASNYIIAIVIGILLDLTKRMVDKLAKKYNSLLIFSTDIENHKYT